MNLDRQHFRGHALPEVVPEDVRALARKGYVRMGVLALFVNDNGEVLMLRHKRSTKNRAGQLGPLGETMEATLAPDGDILDIEQPVQCLTRGMLEELELAPKSIELRGYFTTDWETGDGVGVAFAICPVIDCGDGARFLRDPNTPEIAGTIFMKPDDIMVLPDEELRPGVKLLIRELQEFLSRPIKSRRRMSLRPLQLRLGDWEDVDLRHASQAWS